MALKNWIKQVTPKPRKRKEPPRVSDLVALGKHDEALALLRRRLKKNSNDLHARLRLADLLFQLGHKEDAVENYLLVAEGYAGDGFFDKGHALLAKLARHIPGEPKLESKIARLEQLQELERRRGPVTKALSEGRASESLGTSAFAAQQLWSHIAKCPLVGRLTDAQLERLFRTVDIGRWDEDEDLVEPGARMDELLILMRGEIAAQIVLKTGKRTDLRAFTEGDIIGENALLKEKPWPCHYTAKTRSAALRLSRDNLEELLVGESDPRGLLDALRDQGHDDEVAAALAQVEGGVGSPAPAAPSQTDGSQPPAGVDEADSETGETAAEEE